MSTLEAILADHDRLLTERNELSAEVERLEEDTVRLRAERYAAIRRFALRIDWRLRAAPGAQALFRDAVQADGRMGDLNWIGAGE